MELLILLMMMLGITSDTDPALDTYLLEQSQHTEIIINDDIAI